MDEWLEEGDGRMERVEERRKKKGNNIGKFKARIRSTICGQINQSRVNLRFREQNIFIIQIEPQLLHYPRTPKKARREVAILQYTYL